MERRFFRYLVLLGAFLAVGFFLQKKITDQIPLLLASYKWHFLLGLFSYSLLRWTYQKKRAWLTYAYTATVVAKLAVYFIYFRPVFNQNGAVEKTEFMVFFIPYSIALFLEIAAIAIDFKDFNQKENRSK